MCVFYTCVPDPRYLSSLTFMGCVIAPLHPASSIQPKSRASREMGYARGKSKLGRRLRWTSGTLAAWRAEQGVNCR